MAKKRKGANLSQLVRDHLSKEENASPKEVAEALKSHGVTPALVSNIKYALKTKGAPSEKRGRPTGRRGRRATANGRPSSAYKHVLAAADFIKSCGDVASARAALDAAGEIASALGR
jgi:hypothetical protein